MCSSDLKYNKKYKSNLSGNDKYGKSLYLWIHTHESYYIVPIIVKYYPDLFSLADIDYILEKLIKSKNTSLYIKIVQYLPLNMFHRSLKTIISKQYYKTIDVLISSKKVSKEHIINIIFELYITNSIMYNMCDRFKELMYHGLNIKLITNKIGRAHV